MAIIIAESVKKEMSYKSVYKMKVSANTNDILLNLYGDDKIIDGEYNYKAFPDIGEDIVNQKLTGRRRINYDELLVNMKFLNEINEGDTVFYANGKIVDINIYSNVDRDKLNKEIYNTQILKYLDLQDKYYKEIISVVSSIIEKDGEDVLSDDLIQIYNEALMRLDKDNYFTNANNKFDNYIIEFTILEHNEIKIGSKLCNRYGAKGVVSAIVPDELMPVIEEGPCKGKHAKIILNSLGVMNRLMFGRCKTLLIAGNSR